MLFKFMLRAVLYASAYCEYVFVCYQVSMCSSPESHCVHGVGSWGDLATDQDRRLKEAFVWDSDDHDQIKPLVWPFF